VVSTATDRSLSATSANSTMGSEEVEDVDLTIDMVEECTIVTDSSCGAQTDQIALLQEKLSAERLKNRSLRREIMKCKRREDLLAESLKGVFNTDQIDQLRGSRHGCWTTATVRKAMQIRAATGKIGYEFLRTTMGYPLPSYRTISKRVQVLEMRAGLDTSLLDLLKLKTQDMSPRERDCVLILDEVQLLKKVEYDVGLKQMSGYVSREFLSNPNEANQLASHALVMCVLYTMLTSTVALG